MRLLIILTIFVSTVHAQEILDLGNLDIKGNLNLPKYSLESENLTLKSSLKKIATIEYEKNSELHFHESSKSPVSRIELTEQSDFKFDLDIRKVRLD